MGYPTDIKISIEMKRHKGGALEMDETGMYLSEHTKATK
jgi:hypothetical protein